VLAATVHGYMRTPATVILPLAAAAALLTSAPAAAAASGSWSKAQGFHAGGDMNRDPVPRAAIAADGSSALAFTSKSGALMLSTGSPNGRFGAPRVIERRGASDWSIAAAPGAR